MTAYPDDDEDYEPWYEPDEALRPEVGSIILDETSAKPKKRKRTKRRPVGFIHFKEPKGRRVKRQPIGFISHKDK